MTKAKKSKKTKTTAKTSAPVATPVVATHVVATPVAAVESTEVSVVQALSDSFSEILSQLSTLRTSLTAITTATRTLQKKTDRELKSATKNARKRKQKSGTRAPSGFVKPTKISSELASFLGKAPGSEMARTQVTREINTYIRSHKLQDPTNGRRIFPDAKLRKLLRLKKDDELTYFNLQRFMSPHFAKKNKPLAEDM